jgi:AraC family transcriptional regulator of adaptative response / DNA-3-methyladenine glycosylase II
MLPHSGRLWPPAQDWDRRADVVGRALRLIADGVVDREGVAGLARRLGCGPRQLHGQLVTAVGAGPQALARAQRAQIARQLLETTALPIPEVAFAAGFGSVRQFNQTLREAFALPPAMQRSRSRSRARARAGAGRPARGEVVLRLP